MSFKLKPKKALVVGEFLEKNQIVKALIGYLCVFRAFVTGRSEYLTEKTVRSVQHIRCDLSIWLQKL